MSTKTVNFRIDEKLKNEAEDVLSGMGLNMSSALTMFLKQVVNKRAIPFIVESEDYFYTQENQMMLAERIAKYNAGIKLEKEIIE